MWSTSSGTYRINSGKLRDNIQDQMKLKGNSSTYEPRSGKVERELEMHVREGK